MNYSSKQSDFQRVAYSLLVLGSIAFAVYLFAIPAKTVDAQKIGPKKVASPSEQLAVTVFPTSTALPAAIPDMVPAGIDLTIPVAGLTPGHVLRGVELNFTLDQPAGAGGHTWVGDLVMNLSSPAPAATHLIMQRVGSATGTGSGDSTDIQGPYTFADLRVPTPPDDFWATSVAMVGGTVPPGTYRTMACCTGAFTNMSATFQQVVSLSDPRTGFEDSKTITKTFDAPENVVNGNWTLNVSDNATGDTGRVSALSLRLITLPPTAAFAAVQGRVMTAGGQPISRATVTVLNSNSVETTTVQTNQFGYFTFEGLPVGTFYTMWVESGRHTFDSPTQNFVLEGDKTDIVFVSRN